MLGGCPTFCLFYALPGDAFCKCTSEFTRRRAAHSELLSLCFEQTQTQTRLSSSELSRAEASEACGIFSCCFVSTVSSVSLDARSQSSPDLQVL